LSGAKEKVKGFFQGSGETGKVVWGGKMGGQLICRESDSGGDNVKTKGVERKRRSLKKPCH